MLVCWFCLIYILKLETTGLANVLDVRGEDEEKGTIKDGFKFLTWAVGRYAIYRDGDG